MKKMIILAILALGLVPAFAARHTVKVDNNFYNPKNLVVQFGDTIHFQWIRGFHPTASDDGKWQTFQMDQNNTDYELILQSEGEYPYYCTAHGAPGGIGMAGTILVEGISSVEDEFFEPEKSLRTSTSGDILKIFSVYEFQDVHIYNLSGMLLNPMVLKIGQNTASIDIGNMPQGLYFIIARTEGNVVLSGLFIKN
jgi:plastocyanin